MKKTFNLHKKLNKLFINKVTPELLIEFIYKNIYKLIDEIPFVSNELGKELRKNYPLYYSEVIEKSGEEWLETLFPDPELSYYFSFKKFYIGLVSRIFFFSPASEGSFLYYFYGDPMDWSIGYDIFIDQNKYYIKACDFLLLKKFSMFQILECWNISERFDHTFLIFKEKLKKSEEDEVMYLKNETVWKYSYISQKVLSSFSSYKEAIKLQYNSEFGILWKNACKKKKLDNNYLLSIVDYLNMHNN